jgi:hypothetical protein
MKGKFHAISPQMYICRTKGNFLQMVLEGANRWIDVYGFESHQTTTRQKSGGILWTYIEIGKLLESYSRQQFAYDILSNQVGTLFVGSHYKDETGYFFPTQRSCDDMWRKHGWC